MVFNNSIKLQKSDINHELSWNYVAVYIPYINGNHVWPRIRTYFSWVRKIPNWNIIKDNWQNKHFVKSYFQCNIGTDSPGSSKPSADF